MELDNDINLALELKLR